jgi:peroxiredoxin Q/BCP
LYFISIIGGKSNLGNSKEFEMSMPKINNKAPSFKLLNQNSKEIKLSDLKGQNIVLYFYPKALTPGCTTQACGIRDYKKEFKKFNTIVLGVSPDAPAKLLKFIEKHELNFELLSDENLEAAKAYGVYGLKKFMGREYMGVIRTTFIINSEGKLIHIMDDVKTKTHHEDVLTYIKENLV